MPPDSPDVPLLSVPAQHLGPAGVSGLWPWRGRADGECVVGLDMWVEFAGVGGVVAPEQGSSAMVKPRQGARAACGVVTQAEPGEEGCQWALVQGLCLAPVVFNRLLMGRDTALSAYLGTHTLGSL